MKVKNRVSNPGLRALAGSLAFERGKGTPIWAEAWIRTTYIAK